MGTSRLCIQQSFLGPKRTTQPEQQKESKTARKKLFTKKICVYGRLIRKASGSFALPACTISCAPLCRVINARNRNKIQMADLQQIGRIGSSEVLIRKTLDKSISLSSPFLWIRGTKNKTSPDPERFLHFLVKFCF